MRHGSIHSILKNRHVKFQQCTCEIKGDIIVQKIYGKFTFFRTVILKINTLF